MTPKSFLAGRLELRSGEGLVPYVAARRVTIRVIRSTPKMAADASIMLAMLTLQTQTWLHRNWLYPVVANSRSSLPPVSLCAGAAVCSGMESFCCASRSACVAKRSAKYLWYVVFRWYREESRSGV
jgi:hypothetical protein